MLELRWYDPDGQMFEPDAYVFDHANIFTSNRYLNPSKLVLHTTIQRIDA